MATRSRPTGVTIVAIVALAVGVITTIDGILKLISGLTLSGIISLILGILTLAVAGGLFARSQIARILTAIVLVLQLAAAIFNLGSIGFSNIAVIWPIVAGVLSIAGIVLLFTKQANAFFR